MPGIASIIEELLMAAIISEKMLPSKSRMDWALTALSILLGATAIFLLILGFERFLEERYPPDMAALLAAAFIFSAALLAAAAAYRYRRQKVSSFNTARHELGKNIHALIADICGELDDPVRESPKTAVLLAALAGFFTGQHRTGL